MRQPAKPKKATTKSAVKASASRWAFFPEDSRQQIIRAVTSAIDAYHHNNRPQPVDRAAPQEPNSPPPRRPRRGRQTTGAVDMLVARLAQIYAAHTGELGTRSWDLAEKSDFEILVGDAFRIAGIVANAQVAIRRHVAARKKLDENGGEYEV